MLTLLEGSPLGPLMPEHLSEFFVGIALFLIVWAVVAKKVVPVFERTYEERAAAIQGGIEKAERAQAEAQAALKEYQAQLEEARRESGKIREEAKAMGAAIVADMRKQANNESMRILANAKAQIEAERAAAMLELRTEIGGLATTLAGRIVGESLEDDERARRTVDRFLDDLEQTPVEQA